MFNLNDYAFFGFNIEKPSERVVPKEGDLFKVIEAHGKLFELRYGYYDERDRQNSHIEPMEMYPNFIETPLFTDEGIPFATAMQDRCNHFRLKSKEWDEGEDNVCFNCSYYEKCEELLGVCKCKERRKNFEKL